MRQYLDAKRQYRDAIVFFRMGDFYEMFYEDALVASRALDLTLTSRSKDADGGSIPMCGVPYHAAEPYLARLVKKGFRVAICEQVEDPRKAKGLVRREVVRVVSPRHLHRRRLPRCARAGVPDGRGAGRLAADAAGPSAADRARARSRAPGNGRGRRRAARPLDRRVPGRRVPRPGRPAGAGRRTGGPAAARDSSCPPKRRSTSCCPRRRAAAPRVTPLDAWAFDARRARARTLLGQLHTHSLEGFGLEGHPAAVRAAGALVHYLQDTQKADLSHVREHHLQGARRPAGRRSAHAEAPRDRRGDGRRARRLAAQRARSHGDADGRAPAARVAAAAAASRSSGSATASTASRTSRSA